MKNLLIIGARGFGREIYNLALESIGYGTELCARIGNIDKCNFGKLLGSRSNNLSSSPLPDNERRQGV